MNSSSSPSFSFLTGSVGLCVDEELALEPTPIWRSYMDTEKPIHLIHSKECLWNQNSRLYHSKDVQKNGWKAIAAEMKTPVYEIKKKWKSVRDIFRRELKKTKSPGLDDTSGEYVSKWPFYESLCFLEDQMMTKDFKDVLTVKIEEQDADPLLDAHALSPSSFERAISVDVIDSPPEKRAKTQNEHCNYESGHYRVQDETSKLFNDYMQDSEMQFLMSLSPFLKRVKPSRQLAVRAKIMQVLADEQADSSMNHK